MKIERIINDDRKIFKLIFLDDSAIISGTPEIKEIEPYEEDGEMARVVWFAVINQDDEIKLRVNSKFVKAVVYE